MLYGADFLQELELIRAAMHEGRDKTVHLVMVELAQFFQGRLEQIVGIVGLDSCRKDKALELRLELFFC